MTPVLFIVINMTCMVPFIYNILTWLNREIRIELLKKGKLVLKWMKWQYNNRIYVPLLTTFIHTGMHPWTDISQSNGFIVQQHCV